MMKHMQIRIEGVAPGIMFNNIRLANRFDPYAKKIAAIIAKKTQRVDEDYYETARLQWYGGIYLNEQGRVIIPSNGIHAALRGAGTRFRQGKEIERSVIIPDDALLEYEGPKDIDELYKIEKFVDTRMVGGKKNKNNVVSMTRPVFPEWQAVYRIGYFVKEIEKDMLIDIIYRCGIFEGLYAYRPKFGRYNVLSLDELD